MASAVLLLWASWVLSLATADIAKGLGVNWGSQCSQNLPPKIIVKLLEDNGINKVKLFEVDSTDIIAFANRSIEVMVSIPNEDLQILRDYTNATIWVKENVIQYVNLGVSIKYVAVGNEPFLKSYNDLYLTKTLLAMKNIQKALDEAGHGDKKIKATTPMSADVAYSAGSQYPSRGDFRPDIKDVMVEMVRWFDSNKSPFILNMNPFASFINGDSDIPIDLAFFDSTTDPITDGNNTYYNMFDLDFDTLVWALKKAGVPNLEIMVGQIGWPTDGNIKANATTAKRFYDGLVKKIAGKEGTPLRPGQHIEVYLFSLLDENMRSIATGNFERHWGIFRYDGVRKFSVDLSGQGRDNWPVSATGVKYKLPMWCRYNFEDSKDLVQLNATQKYANFEYACELGDCTALTYGSSCNNLNEIGNYTYAFNMYFQMNNHHGNACLYNGLGTLSVFNLSMQNIYNLSAASTTCFFPLALEIDQHLLESAGTRVGIFSSPTAVAGLLSVLFALF